MKDINEIMDEIQKNWETNAELISEQFSIPLNAAYAILYLRTRSRWTIEKEDYLIKLAKEGKPLPNMYEDFEVPKEKKFRKEKTNDR